MINAMTDGTFCPRTLAGDLCAVQRIYAGYFARLPDDAWDRPARRGSTEWTIHETVDHLCALSGAGLEAIRYTLGKELCATLVFQIDGPGGGEWHLDLSPHECASGEGGVPHPSLCIHLRETAVFCHMFTGRFNLPVAVLSGQLRLRGNVPLFLRMGSLFSVDTRN